MLTFRPSPSLFASSPAVTQCSAAFVIAALDAATPARLGVRLPDDLGGAVAKRQAEYLAGRACALQALRGLRPDFSGEIVREPDRAPRWPDGVVGSITHTSAHGAAAAAGATANFASAAVAEATRVRGLGIDSERVMPLETARSIARMLTAPGEAAPTASGLPEAEAYTVLFSAKESVFKCLYPTARVMFSFEHARLEIDRAAGAFGATLLIDLGAGLRAGDRFTGRFVLDPPFVHTALLWPA